MWIGEGRGYVRNEKGNLFFFIHFFQNCNDVRNKCSKFVKKRSPRVLSVKDMQCSRY